MNYQILENLDSLKCLFIHTKDAYIGYSFDEFAEETLIAYNDYVAKKNHNAKTFSQWVNGQILALTN